MLLERVDAGDPARQLAGGGAGRPGPLSPEGGVVFAPILPDGIRSAARSMGERSDWARGLKLDLKLLMGHTKTP